VRLKNSFSKDTSLQHQKKGMLGQREGKKKKERLTYREGGTKARLQKRKGGKLITSNMGKKGYGHATKQDGKKRQLKEFGIEAEGGKSEE